MRLTKLKKLLILDVSVFAILGVCSVVIVAQSFPFSRRKATNSSAPARRANSDAKRSLGPFTALAGTPILMASIHSDRSDRSSSGISSSYADYSGSKVHNYVFLNINDQSVCRLLTNNDASIPRYEKIPEDIERSRTPDNTPQDKVDVEWLLYHVVKQDTNQDGELDDRDLFMLAISDASGGGYTELIGDVKVLYGRALRDPKSLVVIYEAGGTKRIGVVDLPGRTVKTTTSFPDFGPDVK